MPGTLSWSRRVRTQPCSKRVRLKLQSSDHVLQRGPSGAPAALQPLSCKLVLMPTSCLSSQAPKDMHLPAQHEKHAVMGLNGVHVHNDETHRRHCCDHHPVYHRPYATRNYQSYMSCLFNGSHDFHGWHPAFGRLPCEGRSYSDCLEASLPVWLSAGSGAAAPGSPAPTAGQQPQSCRGGAAAHHAGRACSEPFTGCRGC